MRFELTTPTLANLLLPCLRPAQPLDGFIKTANGKAKLARVSAAVVDAV